MNEQYNSSPDEINNSINQYESKERELKMKDKSKYKLAHNINRRTYMNMPKKVVTPYG